MTPNDCYCRSFVSLTNQLAVHGVISKLIGQIANLTKVRLTTDIPHDGLFLFLHPTNLQIACGQSHRG